MRNVSECLHSLCGWRFNCGWVNYAQSSNALLRLSSRKGIQPVKGPAVVTKGAVLWDISQCGVTPEKRPVKAKLSVRVV